MKNNNLKISKYRKDKNVETHDVINFHMPYQVYTYDEELVEKTISAFCKGIHPRSVQKRAELSQKLRFFMIDLIANKIKKLKGV